MDFDSHCLRRNFTAPNQAAKINEVNKMTIYEAFKIKLNREPTHIELVKEVQRILEDEFNARQPQPKQEGIR